MDDDVDRHRPALTTLDAYRRAFSVLAIVPLAWIAVFFVNPLLTMVVREFSWSSVADVLGRGGTRHVLWFTVWQAIASTALTLVIAWPTTWALARYTFRGRRAVRGTVSAPFVLPTVVVAASIRSVLPGSFATGPFAIVVAHALFNVAVVVRIVGSRWERESTAVVDVARTLGMSPLRAFLMFTWPRLRSSVTAACGVVFVFCFMSFGVVRILGGSAYSTLELEIFTRAVQLGDYSGAVALSMVQIVVVLVVLLVVVRWTDVVTADAVVHAVPARTFPQRRRIVFASCTATVAAILAPFVSMLIRSFRTRHGWSTQGWTRLFDGSFSSVGVNALDAVVNSLAYALVTIALSLPLSLCAAAVIAYSSPRNVVARMLGVVSTAPLATSAVALGLGIIVSFDSSPINWRHSWWMFPCVYSVVALPLMVRTLTPALRAIPSSWRDAASTLGTSPLRTWWRVDVRSVRRPIALAVGLGAAVSLGEFGATSFLTRSGHETLPVSIARLLGRPGDVMQSGGYALSCVMAIVVIGVMARA